MVNVVDCAAVGSPVLLEFLISEVLYRVSTEMLMFFSSPLACDSFSFMSAKSPAGQFCHKLAHLVQSTQRVEAYGCGCDSSI